MKRNRHEAGYRHSLIVGTGANSEFIQGSIYLALCASGTVAVAKIEEVSAKWTRGYGSSMTRRGLIYPGALIPHAEPCPAGKLDGSPTGNLGWRG